MFTRLETASSLVFPQDGSRVQTAEEYLGWHASQLLAGSGCASRYASLRTPDAYVNHGRWVADCECGGGMLTHPEWRVACCADCGAVYGRVDVPAAHADIERELLLRPRRENQNWLRHETVEDLRRENLQNGVYA